MHLFSWHSGDNALVCAVAADNGQVAFVGFKSSDLRKAGWTINDEDMRKSLPRFDPPQIATAGGMADVRAAARVANGAKGVDRLLKGR